MKKTMRMFFGLFCISVIAACSGPGDQTAFKPPAGWNSTPGIMGRFQMWMSGEQILMLIRGDQSMTMSSNANSQPWAQGGLQNLQDLKTSQITLCGGQRAQYFSGRGTHQSGSKKTPELIEGVLTQIGSDKYLAMYMRPDPMRPDPQAETALHSICAK